MWASLPACVSLKPATMSSASTSIRPRWIVLSRVACPSMSPAWTSRPSEPLGGSAELFHQRQGGRSARIISIHRRGTPPDRDGAADISHVLAVAESIGRFMKDIVVVVAKSTVPVGTADKVRATVSATITARGENLEFDVVSNPEFLKEGSAIRDFMSPDRIVVGSDNPRTAELLKILYDPFTRNHERISLWTCAPLNSPSMRQTPCLLRGSAS